MEGSIVKIKHTAKTDVLNNGKLKISRNRKFKKIN